MYYRRILYFPVLAIREFQSHRLKYIVGFITVGAWLICLQLGPSIVMFSFCASLIILLFLIRVDIAFYTLISIWISKAALPLPMESPFTTEPGVMSDLPLIQALLPMLGLILVVQIAMGKRRPASSPLNVSIVLWFGFTFLTYFRNPVFLGDLLHKSGTGVIYHTVFPLFLCAIFYLSAVVILRTEERIILAVKVIFVTMIVCIILAWYNILAGLNIPGFTEGAWSVDMTTGKAGTVFRSSALSGYSYMLLIALICFCSHISKPLQLLTSLILLITLVVGGGRGELLSLSISLILISIIQRRSSWLVASLLLLIILFILLVTPNIKLPYTAHRIFNISSKSGPGGSSLAGRLRLVKAVGNVAKKHPLIGVGYGRFGESSTEVHGFYFNKMVASGNTHAGFLGVIMTYGLVGFTIFLWLVFTAIRTIWRLYRSFEDNFLKKLLLWIMVQITISTVTFFVSFEMEKSNYLYFMIGMASSMYALSLQKNRPAGKTAKGSDIRNYNNNWDYERL